MTLNVYIGWTGEGALAYEICRASLLAKATIPIRIFPLRHWELRHSVGYSRPYSVSGAGQRFDGRDGTPFSTDFSFTRFLVPALEDYAPRWALYCDSDMLWLADVAELLDEVAAAPWTVACVQHDWQPRDSIKMTGVRQCAYPRKNWSSLMLMHGARCRDLTVGYINDSPGAALHRFEWLLESEIGALPSRWNVLHGEQTHWNPAVVHFTNGTPDMAYHAQDDSWSSLWLRVAAALQEGSVERVREVLS